MHREAEGAGMRYRGSRGAAGIIGGHSIDCPWWRGEVTMAQMKEDEANEVLGHGVEMPWW